MLIDFFFALKSAKIPVSIKEYLILLEGLRKDVIGPSSANGASIDDFYYLVAQRRSSRTNATTTSSTRRSAPTSTAASRRSTCSASCRSTG